MNNKNILILLSLLIFYRPIGSFCEYRKYKRFSLKINDNKIWQRFCFKSLSTVNRKK